MKKIFFFVVFIPFLLQTEPTISPQQAQEIGKKIWQNECNGTIEGLTSWNPGEEFASLGIGHFIWHPKQKNTTFNETFPKLRTFLQNNNTKIPYWLSGAPYCPWKNRTEFLGAQKSRRMQQLRTILASTIELQTQFMIQQLFDAIPHFETKLSSKTYEQIKKQFLRISQSPNGWYALVDYANFKGIGFETQEQYNNQGWGLIQVLEKMKGTKPGKTALEEFALTAKNVLQQRVVNAPKERNEQQWIPGWFNRINTYAQ